MYIFITIILNKFHTNMSRNKTIVYPSLSVRKFRPLIILQLETRRIG